MSNLSMNRPTCYIVSLRYAPGLAKEFGLLGENLAQFQWNVEYLLSNEYEWLLKQNLGEPSKHYLMTSATMWKMLLSIMRYPSVLFHIHRLFARNPPSLLLFYNTHPLNWAIIRLAQQVKPDGIRTMFLHEPYVPEKSSYGTLRSWIINVAEYLQTNVLKRTTCVLVPSPHAQQLFAKKYPDYTKPIYLSPILLPSLKRGASAQRKYISLVGNLNQSRSADEFIALVNLAAESALGLEFKLVTRSSISSTIEKLSPQAKQILTVINKPAISDEEIADTLAESWATILPHKQAAQSGNIPVAFREGTPVIARAIPGLMQHVQHGRNGAIYPVDGTTQDLLEAVLFVREHFIEMSKQALQDFEDIFAESNWRRYYAWLIR